MPYTIYFATLKWYTSLLISLWTIQLHLSNWPVHVTATAISSPGGQASSSDRHHSPVNPQMDPPQIATRVFLRNYYQKDLHNNMVKISKHLNTMLAHPVKNRKVVGKDCCVKVGHNMHNSAKNVLFCTALFKCWFYFTGIPFDDYFFKEIVFDISGRTPLMISLGTDQRQRTAWYSWAREWWNDEHMLSWIVWNM